VFKKKPFILCKRLYLHFRIRKENPSSLQENEIGTTEEALIYSFWLNKQHNLPQRRRIEQDGGSPKTILAARLLYDRQAFVFGA
jgi:hypothetical protein